MKTYTVQCGVCNKDFLTTINHITKSIAHCPYCTGIEDVPQGIVAAPPPTPPEVHCPKCKSTQITANKKGFGIGKAVAGAALTGGVGLLAGFIGSGKVKVTCLNCGFEFSPGQK